ncbi:hypothetical protein Tco_0898250, partial [Tanacetum coccineum]
VREHATRGWEILTQGDNNRAAVDSPLYASGTLLNEKDVMGRVYWYIPYLGWFTILTNQYPLPKTAVHLTGASGGAGFGFIIICLQSVVLLVTLFN